ncbi:MAG: efflux RND transporter periplasmic adaptor subunit [Lysobacteraceae bacterium]
MPRSIVSRTARVVLLSSVLLPLTLLTACGGGDGGAQQAGQGMPAPEVTVVTLGTQPITLERELPGRITPHLVAEVRPQVGGIVARRLFEEGSLVEEGSVLYQLDDAAYRADVASAQAAVNRAQAVLKTAKLTAERNADLLTRGLISREANDNAVSALGTAEADVGVARAALQSSRIRLGYASIVAPISGRIGKSSVTQGALVTANQEAPLATINAVDPVYVDLTQSSSELLALRREIDSGSLQQPEAVAVEILLEDGARYPQAATLAFTDATVNPETDSYLLRALAPNPDGLLMPGMYVRARIVTGHRENGLLVPQQGVSHNARGEPQAMLVGADGNVEQRVIQVSGTLGDQWIVEGGLAAGDRVIVEGLQKIRPGAPVRAVEMGAAAAAQAPAQATGH